MTFPRYIATTIDTNDGPVTIGALVHRDGRVFLAEDAWRWWTTGTLITASAAAFRLTAEAQQALGGEVRVIGVAFEQPGEAPALRVEVTGGIGRGRMQRDEFIRASLYVDGRHHDTSTPYRIAVDPLPSFYDRVLAAGKVIASQMIEEWHAFAAELPEIAGAP